MRALTTKYSVVIEKTDNGYSAYAPDLPGCARLLGPREEVRVGYVYTLAAAEIAKRIERVVSLVVSLTGYWLNGKLSVTKTARVA